MSCRFVRTHVSRSSSGVRMPATITRGRLRRGSTGCSGAAASRPSPSPSAGRASAERVERVLRAARVVLARAGRRQQPERVPPGVDERRSRAYLMRPPSRAPRSRARRATRARACPPARQARAARRARSRGPGGRGPASSRPGLAELALHPVADDGVADRLRHGEAEPRLAALALVAREPVEDEEPRRGRAAAAVDGVEVPGARQAVPALHAARIVGRAQAESRLRPLARRRFRIACPARVDMRARKPCLRLRRRTLGW